MTLDICEYTDYRKFLADYYKTAKAGNRRFSFNVFSLKAGIKSKGFLHNVIQGKRTLSKPAVAGLAHAMKLNKHESEYLEYLVAFNQADNEKDKGRFYEMLSSIKKDGKTAWMPQVMRQDQYEFFSEHHHSVIRSLIEMYGFKDEFQWLANSVRPKIRPLQAKKSVQLLERLGLVKKLDGRYKVTDKSIVTQPEVMSLAVRSFHKKAGQLALRALDEIPKEERNITALTLGISKETYQGICEELQDFRLKLLEKAEKDKNADSVYQLNFQFFRVGGGKNERRLA